MESGDPGATTINAAGVALGSRLRGNERSLDQPTKPTPAPSARGGSACPSSRFALTRTAPISPSARTCVPPQGCKSRPAISISRTRPDTHRRLHRHGLDQAGIGFEFGVADPAVADGSAGRDHGHQCRGDFVLVEAGLGNIEVEPALDFADRRRRSPRRAAPPTTDASPCACACARNVCPSRSWR